MRLAHPPARELTEQRLPNPSALLISKGATSSS
jgi:hypothetical protein